MRAEWLLGILLVLCGILAAALIVLLNKTRRLEAAASSLKRLEKNLQEKITESERDQARVSVILDHMTEGVIAVDRGKQILLANPSAERIFSASPGTFRDRSLIEAVKNQKLDALMDQALAGKTLLNQEIDLVQPERKALHVNVIAVSQGGQAPAGLVVFHDISEVRRLENLRRDFVANVSHELRTPLTSIKGFVETLLAGALADRTQSETFLRMMEEDANRLTRLIDDLLELSKIESRDVPLKLENLDLAEIFSNILVLFRLRFERKKIRVENRLAADPSLKVRADRDRLKQVLVNLLDNAVKFNRTGGTIILSAEAQDRQVKTVIEDTGIGIPPKDVPRVFERFFRADRARTKDAADDGESAEGGSGLGLAIVKHIIESHGGGISCESRLNEGSRFCFTLPKA